MPEGTLIKEVINNTLGAPSCEILHLSPTHRLVTTWYDNGSPSSEEELEKAIN